MRQGQGRQSLPAGKIVVKEWRQRMIKGKAKMEFGTGDIRMTACLSDKVGALCCVTQEPHEIGERAPVTDKWNPGEAQVIMTFTKPESVDALIAELMDARDMMTGTYEGDLVENEGFFDLDSFMKGQNRML